MTPPADPPRSAPLSPAMAASLIRAVRELARAQRELENVKDVCLATLEEIREPVYFDRDTRQFVFNTKDEKKGASVDAV